MDEDDALKWFFDNLGTILGISRVVKGFPAFGAPNFAAPSATVILAEQRYADASGKRVGGITPMTSVFHVGLFGRNEDEKAKLVKAVRRWAQRTKHIEDSGQRAAVRYAGGYLHEPSSEQEIERYGFMARIEVDHN